MFKLQMPPAVKDGRVTKKPSSQPQSRSPSRSRSGLRLSKWHQEQVAKEDEKSTPTNQPLVERTNALSLSQLIAQYISAERLHIKASSSRRRNEQQHITNNTEEVTYSLEIQGADTIPESTFEVCFSLIELTSSQDYRSSSIGWSPSKKRKEMRLPDMRYMILRPATTTATPSSSSNSSKEQGSPVQGFVAFMTTYEDSHEVLYCYEIHLHPSVQGLGLGKQLMRILEDVGRNIGLEKTMLTVFRANQAAVNFYMTGLGYTVDEFSPPPRKLRNGSVKEVDYLTLSKALK